MCQKVQYRHHIPIMSYMYFKQRKRRVNDDGVCFFYSGNGCKKGDFYYY